MVPLAVLVGLSDAPGELVGYGPITAETARRLAGDALWRRLLVDPAGQLLEYGRAVYRPPTHLAEHVIARDQICGFPGCQVPARRCDLDHAVPFTKGGTTGAANLTALCRRHHRAKHDGGWRLRRNDDHSCTWTSPTGHVYTSRPPRYPDQE